MRLSIIVLSVALMLMAPRGIAEPTRLGSELCHNGGFQNAEKALDGWMIDYAWTGNSHYVGNKANITFLPRYGGKSNVMHVDGRGGETKVECLPIPFERGARYRCTIDYKTTAGPHIYFAGYKWKPGIRPYHDKPIHIGDLRMIYKSTFRKHKVRSLSGGWKRETFEIPMHNASELSIKHMKYVRFITVYFILPGGGGEAWINKVSVTRIK
jgi:hypothetical protein